MVASEFFVINISNWLKMIYQIVYALHLKSSSSSEVQTTMEQLWLGMIPTKV